MLRLQREHTSLECGAHRKEEQWGDILWLAFPFLGRKWRSMGVAGPRSPGSSLHPSRGVTGLEPKRKLGRWPGGTCCGGAWEGAGRKGHAPLMSVADLCCLLQALPFPQCPRKPDREEERSAL